MDSILDATADLLADHDPGSLTMSAIGERAGVSKAAIYRYYPDRPSVIRALAQRYLDSHSEQIDLSSPAPTTRDEAAEQIGRLVDDYHRRVMTDPVLRGIWVTGYSQPDVGDLSVELNRMMASQLSTRFESVLSGGGRGSAETRLLLAVHMLRSAVQLAVHVGDEAGNRILSDSKDMLVAAVLGSDVTPAPAG